MSSKIIALTGLKQSGKSTVAKYLEEVYGFRRINFKDALLAELKEYFPDFLSAEAEYHKCTINELLEKKPGHIRQLLQNFGTELRRGENENYWVDQWRRHILFGSFVDKVVVDDCRFLNEAAAIRGMGGKIIRVMKTGQEMNDSHASESEMKHIQVDHIIAADQGDHEMLIKQVDKIMESIIL